MKKVIVCLVASILLIAVFVIAITTKRQDGFAQVVNDNCLRIHIRANSNLDEDQAVKFKVKEKIVEFVTPAIAGSQTQQEAKDIVRKNLKNIQSIANKVLEDEGFLYGSTVELRTEEFPTRTYGETTLESGLYEALIVELGSGTGNNWWCVVFPPLCFIGGAKNDTTEIKYKSKIWEMLHNLNN